MQGAVDPILSPQFALAGAVLAAGGAAFACLPLGLLRHAYPTRQVPRVPWGLLHLGLVALLYFSVGILLAGLAGGLGGEIDLVGAIVATAASQGIVVATILYWAHKFDPLHGPACLGLRRGGNLRAAIVGVVAGLLCFPAIIGTNFLWPWLFERLGGDFEQQFLVEAFAESTGIGVWVAFVAAALVVPLFEELIFRGFLQSLAIQRLGELRGIVLTSAVFAILHGASSFLPIFGLALVLGVIMVRTGRIVAPWALHGLFNGGQLVFLLYAKALSELAP